MLLEYVEAAMRKAVFETLPDGEGVFGRIPECQGVWANASTEAACRAELQSVLEDWILIRARRQLDLPVIDGFDLNPHTVEEPEVA